MSTPQVVPVVEAPGRSAVVVRGHELVKRYIRALHDVSRAEGQLGESGQLVVRGKPVILVFIGLTVSARWFVRPLAAPIGLPVARAFHEPGRIARENAMRNPTRTAITSAALMVGVGLVVFVSVFAAGLKASVGHSLDRYVKADYVVTSSKSQPLPAGIGPAVAKVPGVAAYTALLVDQVKVGSSGLNGATDTLDGIDARSLRKVYAPQWVKGSDALLGDLGGHNALIEQQFAKAHKLAVGDTFRLTTASGGTTTLRAIGEYRDPQILQGVIVDRSTFGAVSSARDPFGWFVKLAPGANAANVHAALQATVKAFPPAEVSTLAEYKQTLSKRLVELFCLWFPAIIPGLLATSKASEAKFLAVIEEWAGKLTPDAYIVIFAGLLTRQAPISEDKLAAVESALQPATAMLEMLATQPPRDLSGVLSRLRPLQRLKLEYALNLAAQSGHQHPQA